MRGCDLGHGDGGSFLGGVPPNVGSSEDVGTGGGQDFQQVQVELGVLRLELAERQVEHGVEGVVLMMERWK